MKNFKKLLVLALALVITATFGISTSVEAATGRFTNVKVTNNVAASSTATTLTLAKGKKVTLKATSTPTVKATFKSGNPSVLSVSSDGVVTARKAGLANVHVRFGKSGYTTVYKTITIRVTSGKVTKVTVSGASVVKGKTVTPKSSVKTSGSNPNKALKWSSSNTAIAKVDAKTGKVTGIKPGKVTITARATDGTWVYDRCTVTVKNTVTSVNLASEYPTKMYVGQTYYGFKGITNSDAFDTAVTMYPDTKYSSNPAVATVVKRSGNNFKVRANMKGTLILTVRANSKNPNGAYTYKKVTVKIVDRNVVKVEPKAGTTAVMTVNGDPSAIAQDLETAIRMSGVTPKNITVTIDGVEKEVTYKDGKVYVGATWLGSVSTRTGKIGVTIKENLADYIENMDLVNAYIQPLEKSVKEDVKEKVKGLLYHKVGDYIVYGTDNIIISKMINIVTVGFYSNYSIIINTLTTVLGQIISAVTPSVGNLLVEENKSKNYQIYKKLSVINFWIYSVVSICIFFLVQDFIIIWLGESYLFDLGVVFWIVLNFWQKGMRGAINVFKEAGGIFYVDRYIPIIEAIINIVVSVIGVHICGLAGVFIGTFVSSLCLFLYSYPILVFQPLFEKKSIVYVLDILKYFGQWIVCLGIVDVVMYFYRQYIIFPNVYIAIVMKAVVVFLLSNMLMWCIYGKSEDMKFFYALIRKRIWH